MLKSKDSGLHGQNRETSEKLYMPERDNSHNQQDPRQLTPEEEQERKRTGTKVSSKSFIWMIVAWTILVVVVGGFYLFVQGMISLLTMWNRSSGGDLFIIAMVYVLGLKVAFSIRPRKRLVLLVNRTLYSILAIVILGPIIFILKDSNQIIPLDEHDYSYYQLSLFKDHSGQRPKEALALLCRLASSGNLEARVILGNIFEYGGHIWIEEGIVKSNYNLAYVWYTLSDKYDQEDMRHFAEKWQLDAEKVLDDWEPGNCERDLGLAQNN